MGQEYDYVFDVDFKEGSPTLKLPYNITQNPYEAAQKFLFAHEMPQEYMDQVVQFIEKNTGGVALGTGNNDYVDPYTGASRYTGGGAESTSVGSSAGGFSGDPYTGELLRLVAQFEALTLVGTGGGRSAPAASKTPSLLPHVHSFSLCSLRIAAKTLPDSGHVSPLRKSTSQRSERSWVSSTSSWLPILCVVSFALSIRGLANVASADDRCSRSN